MPVSRRRKPRKGSKDRAKRPMSDEVRAKFTKAMIVKVGTDAKNDIRKQAASNSMDGGQWLPKYARVASDNMARVDGIMHEELESYESQPEGQRQWKV
jgi:hypothetical protein